MNTRSSSVGGLTFSLYDVCNSSQLKDGEFHLLALSRTLLAVLHCPLRSLSPPSSPPSVLRGFVDPELLGLPFKAQACRTGEFLIPSQM